MSSVGNELFAKEASHRFGDAQTPFKASVLGSAPTPAVLRTYLSLIPDVWETWLEEETRRARTMAANQELSAALHSQATLHVQRARDMVRRMRDGIDLIASRSEAFKAFQLAHQAMHLQGQWKSRSSYKDAKEAGASGPAQQAGSDLIWRPFQLGFQLLSVGSLIEPRGPDDSPSPERLTMDLLWFPTGGGKTEAYLALIAFVAFLRRLRNGAGDDGAGVTTLMRYTLRLLTVQQFERASRLILACELLRRRHTQLGRTAFSIGLWVGEGTTPNKVDDARSPGGESARQLKRCPVCALQDLRWNARPGSPEYAVECTNPKCELRGDVLPVWTVDEDVYRVRPTLLLGTIDKFAQLVFKEDTQRFFGDEVVPPPELIIQDELHLISGPLGTLAALYEAAIDRLCQHKGIPAKIIGSTATIRRAEPQVRALFDRAVCQFPPPILEAGDSCFGVIDTDAPGRTYVGLTTAGRSPKFTLQAGCGSLLQGASELPTHPAEERDPFWTLVAYFNSLRELGGALVMLYDDVPDSIELYSRLHGTTARSLNSEFIELTSRINSSEIPARLAELEVPASSADACDVTLATNMLSVGVDIPRLGLMVVNGQPKSMSEYIQATSRVGRNKVPGLILTVYNAGRPRDRSHFESFKTWHQMLYREVEATSVTPFAPRARDRALHAAIVAVARHRIASLSASPAMRPEARAEAEEVANFMARRAANIPAEAAEEDFVRNEALHWLDEWESRGALKYYRKRYDPEASLLISAEEAAANAALGKPITAARSTPNSMREVEPTVVVRLISQDDRTTR